MLNKRHKMKTRHIIIFLLLICISISSCAEPSELESGKENESTLKAMQDDIKSLLGVIENIQKRHKALGYEPSGAVALLKADLLGYQKRLQKIADDFKETGKISVVAMRNLRGDIDQIRGMLFYILHDTDQEERKRRGETTTDWKMPEIPSDSEPPPPPPPPPPAPGPLAEYEQEELDEYEELLDPGDLSDIDPLHPGLLVPEVDLVPETPTISTPTSGPAPEVPQ